MSGSGQLWIPPSALVLGALAVGQTVRGIPTPNVPASGAAEVYAPSGTSVPTCANLLAASPPTLLEEFEVVAFSIACGAYLGNSPPSAFTTAPTILLELALLVNDRPRYSTSQEVTSILVVNSDYAIANLVLGADIVNPIRLGARDRLSLQIGVQSDTAASNAFNQGFVGAQYNQTAAPFALESTISYNVIDLPASRRL